MEMEELAFIAWSIIPSPSCRRILWIPTPLPEFSNNRGCPFIANISILSIRCCEILMADSISWPDGKNRSSIGSIPRKMELHPIIDERTPSRILINCSSRVAYLFTRIAWKRKERKKEREKRASDSVARDRFGLFPSNDRQKRKAGVTCRCCFRLVIANVRRKKCESERGREREREESCLMDHLVATVDGNWTFH